MRGIIHALISVISLFLAERSGLSGQIMGIGIGISFGKERACLVALQLHGHKGAVLQCTEQALNEQNSAFADPAQLNGTWHKFFANRIALGLPPKDTATRIFPLPFRRKEQISKTIQFETENIVEAYRQADSVLSYRRLVLTDEPSNTAQSLMFTVSGKRKAVQNSIAALKPLNAKPTTIDTDISAIYNLMCFLKAFPQKGNGVVVCESGEWAYAFFSRNGQMIKARRLRVPPFEREISGFTKVLARDITQTCADMQIEPANFQGCAVGNAFSNAGMAESLSKTTGIDFRTINIAERIAMPDEISGGGWEVALGLAIRAAGRDWSQVNLRSEEFALQGKSVALLSCVALFFAAALTMLIAWQQVYSSSLNKAEERLEEIHAQQKTIQESVLPYTDFKPSKFLENVKRAAELGGNYDEDAAMHSSLIIVKALEEAMDKIKSAAKFEIVGNWEYGKGKGFGNNSRAYALRITLKIVQGTQQNDQRLVAEINKNKMLVANIKKSDSIDKSFVLIIAFQGAKK